MTMTAAERERLTDIAADQASIRTEAEHMKKSIDRIHSRLDEMHGYLKGMTADVSGILCQNEHHEERLSMLQELTASLSMSVREIEKSCTRLKHMLFGFLSLLIVLAFLVGLLGEEVLPKALKWIGAIVGL